MNEKHYSITFYDEQGEVVKNLSKEEANANDVMAACNFLEVGCELSVSCFNRDSKGNRI